MNALKPYFLYRPRQLLRRVRGQFQAPPSARIMLPWALPLRINPQEDIGRSIWRTGVYEMATTEAVHRLLGPGDTAIDAGANIGYMTGLMAARAGRAGRVHAFEPHPFIFRNLQENIGGFRTARTDLAPIEAHEAALSNQTGTHFLVVEGPDGNARFRENQGTARLGDPGRGRQGVEVRMRTLDSFTEIRHVHLLKIDVEGHELQVLEGARRLLEGRHIDHVVFEDHAGFGSDVHRLLSEHGYTIFQLSYSLRRPLLLDEGSQEEAVAYEAPNFLATLHPDRTARLFARSGWQALHTERPITPEPVP